MKVKQWFSFFVVLCSILLLTACGSNSGSGGDQSAAPAEDDLGSDTETGIQYVGAATCIGCHEDFSWSAEIVEEYLQGKHVVHSDHITQANAADGCLDCHDPVGDGPGLAGLIDAENVPADGLAAVGCENCHGAGGDHYGVGPIPIAEPGIEQCAACHDQLPDSHLGHHPEANFIGTNFVASKHYTASVRNEAVCSRCHTDLGGRLYKDVTTKTQLEASVLPVASDEPVQCRTCHNPHNAGGLLFEEVEDHGHVVASGEYATCTSCHMSDSDTPENEEWMYHEDAYYRIITDTHYDDPATTDIIEGYVVDPLSERACRGCHDVHAVEEIRADDDSSSFSNTINDQWARSGHAGAIGDIKLETAEYYDGALGLNRTIEQSVAIKEAATDAAAWAHYDWDAKDRRDCQRCHTATGAANFLSNPTSYDSTANDFSHLVGWAVDAEDNVTSSGQNELLYCWGCHSNNNGGLNNPGAFTVEYTVDSVNPTLPDLGKTNTCVPCHTGRGNMDSLGSSEDPFATAPATSATKTHYLNGAATLFAADLHPGYEYQGLSYEPPSYFAHDSIGLNLDSPETGTGPCVSCHMESAEGHTFEVVQLDASENIIALKSNVCVECHSGAHGAALVSVDTVIDGVTHTAADAAAFLEEEAAGYHEALELLQHQLATHGTLFAASYPYFFNDTNSNGILDADEMNRSNGFTAWENAGHLGAAHNFNYLHHEPGAYAHNRYYTKRLIFDSIDWLDNGALDGSITIDEGTYPEAAAWLSANADTNLASRPLTTT